MKRLLATTLLSISTFAANAEWKLVGSDSKFGLKVYVEDTRLRVSGDIAKAWVMY